MKNATKKKIFTLTLALALATVFCGCQTNSTIVSSSPTTEANTTANTIQTQQTTYTDTTHTTSMPNSICAHNWLITGYTPNGSNNGVFTDICSYECTKCLATREDIQKCTIADEGLWCPYCGQSLDDGNVNNVDETYQNTNALPKEDTTIKQNAPLTMDTIPVDEHITNYTLTEIEADSSLFGLGEITNDYNHSHYVVGKLEGTTLTITKNGNESDGKLATISRVTDFKKITKVVIEPGVEIIDGNAFENCENLVDIEFPETLNEICRYAFLNCYGLRTIKLPDSVKYLGYGTFMNCKNLKEVTLSNGLKTLPQAVFFNCSALEQIIIPNNIAVIEMQVFTNCSNLTHVEFSNNLIWVGFSAFANCTALVSVELPESIKTIDHYAFQGCTNLESVTIHNAEKILNRVFKNCESLEVINFKGTVDEWNHVIKRDGWNENTGNFIIHCTDGDVY